ncbi:ATP-binding protein [Metasolibacillus sp.]|uniref:ATP-binding protein n=1 Tax=Metasolibacillus sp. TaxID=2703680 RepID=UPI0025F9399F|nr:ATP-binding protein [Metasolibacillus sp.]MCT6923805.1 ATP-binding protein [Metasolibacillus sp.]MCT6939962.1 ATP-binding protein [Metasolibacillus sp.]
MKWIYKPGIRFKITIGYVVIIVCLIASVFLLNYQVKSLQTERNYLLNYNSQMRTDSSRIEKHVLNMHIALHNYAITGDMRELTIYESNAEKWQQSYYELTKLMNQEQQYLEYLQQIQEDINTWVETVGNPVIVLKQNNDTEAITALLIQRRSTTLIDEIQAEFTTFRDKVNMSIQEKAMTLDEQNRVLTGALFAFLGFISLISILLANTISRRIVNTVLEVKESIQEIIISKNKLSKRIQVNTNDEIYDLANTTNQLLDMLDERATLQENIADIVLTYQGINRIHQLAEVFLREVAQRTNSSFGAFYVQEVANKDTYFVKKAGYATMDIGRERFKKGEGIIGQCAINQQIVHYSQLPEDYQVISTAIGEMKLTSIMILPILLEGETIAVVEFGAIANYSVYEQQLMRQLVENFGLTIKMVLSRMEVEQLLSESQSMTEELQAQSEELQTQSEELRMQTEELTTINDQLETRSKEAEQSKQELEKVAEELRVSSNYKSEFLANMSHELRTPLNSILILSEMLAENTSLSEEEQEYAQIIHSSGEDLLKLINDILDLSKVEAGKLDIIFSEMVLSDVPYHIEKTFLPLATQKQIAFDVQIVQNEAPIFYTDILRFQQILKNLLSNALKFTNEGSVNVVISQIPETEITAEMQHLSTYWLKVAVIDTGIGIPPDKQQMIFETFQQADGATVRKFGGTGLGLSISKQFAQLLGGWITLESKEGKGSTFTLYVPSVPSGLPKHAPVIEEIKQPIEEEIPILTHMDDSILHGKKILVVDDDRRNVYALKQALEAKGMRVISATNGIECIELLETMPNIDVVLMDIMMPSMDGYETMSIIRHTMQLTQLPIIALTAKAMKNDRDKAIAAGASDYISKPLDLEQLFSVLNVWLIKEEE